MLLDLSWPDAFRLSLIAVAISAAVKIRLFAVVQYGYVIHEFDPWFNFRAAEYMVEHGWIEFQAWFDTEVWYPLGRHVGSTTFPGLQLAAWLIYSVLEWVGQPQPLVNICVLIPAGFGALAALLTGLLTLETTRDATAATLATLVMAILPAHTMRSVAGGFDNECIALSLMIATSYCWVRSLRTPSSWPFAFLAAFSYVALVATWGGYVFMLNLIGVHTGVLVLAGRFSSKLWLAYSIWFVLGTAGALTGPSRYLVGWQPFQSLEQLGPTFIFCALQLLRLSSCIASWRRLGRVQMIALQLRLVLGFALLALLAYVLLLPTDFIGPLSARVRGLFIKHTRTGNPLVDSVAEHQATPAAARWHYLHFTALTMLPGLGTLLWKRSDAGVFMLCYGLVGVYFASKMVRLIPLISPVAALAAGAFASSAIGFLRDAIVAEELVGPALVEKQTRHREAQDERMALLRRRQRRRAPGEHSRGPGGGEPSDEDVFDSEMLFADLRMLYDESVPIRRGAGFMALLMLALSAYRFVPHSFRVAANLSEPQIILRRRQQNGSVLVLDDFREAYWWLRDHTPKESRVLAWWDYGYQINGVARRTTLADGNTWNHEHIALLGKCLVSAEPEAHAIARHLADYVLLWTTRHAGIYSDDLAKSPHMARIAGSVYADVDPKAFFMNRTTGEPSAMMARSLLYRMHADGIDDSATPLELFEEAYTTSNKMVRIFKVRDVSEESRAWVAQHGPGYPPALRPVLEQSKAFKQLHGLG